MTEAEYQRGERARLGQALNDWREVSGMTQGQLSHVSGVARRMVNEILSGKGSCTLRTLLRLTRALGLSVVLVKTAKLSPGQRPHPDIRVS